MTARISLACAAFAAAVLASFGSGHAADVTKPNIPVAYALLLDGKDAMYGQLACEIHVRCQLIDNQDTHLKLSVTINSTYHLSGEVNIQCSEPECSFLTWKTSARLDETSNEGRAREFDLYAGEDGLVSADLVHRTRTRVGRILLLFGN